MYFPKLGKIQNSYKVANSLAYHSVKVAQVCEICRTFFITKIKQIIFNNY